MEKNTELQVIQAPESTGIFQTAGNFEHAQRVCKALATSDLVPQNFRNNMGNTLIALELSNRIGASPLMVMQNLAVIHGKPSFSSTFLIAAINQSGKFSSLRFEVTGEGDNRGCVAWAKDSEGERLDGPRVTIAMAKAEGWESKNGSKWKTMPELMLRYRAAAFFSRLYCPEITMGMQSQDEAQDVGYTEIKGEAVSKKVLEIGTPAFDRAVKAIANGKTVDDIREQYDMTSEVLQALLPPIDPEPEEKQPEPTPEPETIPADVEAAINSSEPVATEKKGRVWKKSDELPLTEEGK